MYNYTFCEEDGINPTQLNNTALYFNIIIIIHALSLLMNKSPV